MESKQERFKRLASSRGDRLKREIRLIGNLSNTKNYEFQAGDVDELFTPIDAALEEVKEMFYKQISDGEAR
ncbi:hypothetical protein [Corynebacterium urinipleomorphum]|uniref:hypothetical protein n=1 Tax=Corynebacterium urinipleomorphum TaxID=1852380 RepID=UPI000B355674|nr:hypothetical protein [Corynebacterium urinipleomorphum]